MLERIEHLSVAKQSEVQVRCRIADTASPDLAKAFTSLDLVSDLDVVAREV